MNSCAAWTVRQGGPVALWDDIEETLTAWQRAGEPGISSVRLRITDRSHTYWTGGRQITGPGRTAWVTDKRELQWEHRVA